MSLKKMVPFNIDLLQLTTQLLQGVEPVTSLDRFNGATRNLHESGLFSLVLFGPMGSRDRFINFSYVDIKVPILHPLVYRILGKLKGFYLGVMSGQKYAVWDTTISDFRLSTPNDPDAQTGYMFFLKHWEDIEFIQTGSDTRRTYIEFIEKFRKRATTSKILVLPAGYRDLEVDGTRIKDNELNNHYRRLMSIANSIAQSTLMSNPELLDTPRHSLQIAFNTLFDTILAMVEGKKKLFMGKWASRRVANGTRNVITATDTAITQIGDLHNPSFNSTLVGLYQTMKGLLPVTKYRIRNGYLARVFQTPELPVSLVNRKTLEAESIQLPLDLFNKWGSDEGIEKIISGFSNEALRHKQIEISGHWLALIYRDERAFKVFGDINECPVELRKHVRPITYTEFFYSQMYRNIDDYPMYVTRYPITGIGSIYPSKTYLKTTIHGKRLRELDDQWVPRRDDTYVATEFPILGESFFNSLAPHPGKYLAWVQILCS